MGVNKPMPITHIFHFSKLSLKHQKHYSPSFQTHSNSNISPNHSPFIESYLAISWDI